MNMPDLSRLKSAIVVCIGSMLVSASASAATSDEESQMLLGSILEAHQAQAEALTNYEFSAEWVEYGASADGSTSETSGKIHRVHQGDQCWFAFESTHNNCGTRFGSARYTMETRGVVNDAFFATWALDKDTGQSILPKWFERAPDGRLPDTSRVFDYALTRIRPLEQAMGPGGDSLQALIESFPSDKIVFTCPEESTEKGESRIRVTIELPDHGIPGPWARMLVNPAKGCLVEESIVMGRDGTERSRTVVLTEVGDGVWFPKEIVLETTKFSPTARFRANRFKLLEFNLGSSYPNEQYSLDALDVPPSLLSEYGVGRYYLDGRMEVTTIDGKEHLRRVKRASYSKK